MRWIQQMTSVWPSAYLKMEQNSKVLAVIATAMCEALSYSMQGYC